MFYFLVYADFKWEFEFFPVIILPLVLATMGIAWILTWLRVFDRDINHVLGILHCPVVPISDLQPGIRPATEILDAAALQPDDVHNRGDGDCSVFRPIARLDRLGNLLWGLPRRCLNRLLVVPEDTVEIRRCPLTISPSASKF